MLFKSVNEKKNEVSLAMRPNAKWTHSVPSLYCMEEGKEVSGNLRDPEKTRYVPRAYRTLYWTKAIS